MLIVRAEIWPGGDPAGGFEIGSMEVANESLALGVSSYSVNIQQTAHAGIGIEPLLLDLTVSGHRRSDGVWALVRQILNAAAVVG